VRFENYVACELNARLSLWGQFTGDEYALYYIRNKQKQETDFLILNNGKPWLLAESKLSDYSIAAHHFETMNSLGDIPFVQVCFEPGIMALQKKNACRISANRLFG